MKNIKFPSEGWDKEGEDELIGIIITRRRRFLSRNFPNPIRFEGWIYRSECGKYLIEPNLPKSSGSTIIIRL